MIVVLEGISGAGKTTQLGKLHAALGRNVVDLVGEFSKRTIGRSISEAYSERQERFLRFHTTEAFADQTHFMLLADTVSKVEEASESEAEHVIIDRLFDSWLCYTLAAKNRLALNDELACRLYRSCVSQYLRQNHLTIHLNLDVETAIQRLALRDRFGANASDRRRLEDVSRKFRYLYKNRPVTTIAANRDPEEITESIIQKLRMPYLKNVSP